MNNKPTTIFFSGKYIVRDGIVCAHTAEYKVFPYITIQNPFCSKKTFPYFRRYLYPFYRWKTRSCVEVELDNGKIIRHWYYDTISYSSLIYAQSGLSEFMRNFYYVYPPSE